MLARPTSNTATRWSVKVDDLGTESTHTAYYCGFVLTICNYPGSDTLSTEIRFQDQRVCRTQESRREGGVKINKERLIEKADQIRLNWQRVEQARLNEQRA